MVAIIWTDQKMLNRWNPRRINETSRIITFSGLQLYNKRDEIPILESDEKALLSLEKNMNSKFRLEKFDGDLVGSIKLRLGRVIRMGMITRMVCNEDSELDFESISKLTALSSIYIARNGVHSIPKILLKLKFLQNLSLPNNQLSEIPNWIEKFKYMETLDVSDNTIKNLPLAIGKLTSLKSLNVSGNQLTSIPEFVGQMNSLEMLNISENTLQVFPLFVKNLKNLKYFRFKKEWLVNLPEDFLEVIQSMKSQGCKIEIDQNVFDNWDWN